MNKLELLQMWQQLAEEMGKAQDDLYRLTGATPESPLASSTYKLLDAYTNVLSQLIGDKSEWLSWYAFENDFGKKGLKVKASNKHRLKPIKTLTDLLKIIETK